MHNQSLLTGIKLCVLIIIKAFKAVVLNFSVIVWGQYVGGTKTLMEKQV